MIEKHQDDVKLNNRFTSVYEWLQGQGDMTLTTSVGTHFTVRAAITSRGAHAGEPVIRFFQEGDEYARAYECCWGHYYNCNRARIGMYCKALDAKLDDT